MTASQNHSFPRRLHFGHDHNGRLILLEFSDFRFQFGQANFFGGLRKGLHSRHVPIQGAAKLRQSPAVDHGSLPQAHVRGLYLEFDPFARFGDGAYPLSACGLVLPPVDQVFPPVRTVLPPPRAVPLQHDFSRRILGVDKNGDKEFRFNAERKRLGTLKSVLPPFGTGSHGDSLAR